MVRFAGFRLLIATAVACHARTATPPDAARSLPYSLSADRVDPKQTIAPDIFVDGAPTSYITIEYASFAAARGAQHIVELRYGDLVVATLTDTIADSRCLEPIGEITMYSVGVCVLDSGDVLAGSVDVLGTLGVCPGDSFCRPRCGVDPYDNCPAGTHCTLRVESMTPLASHADCAPVGMQQLGQPCTLVPDPMGAYDNCGKDLLCVSGTCRQTCSDSLGRACSGCAPMPGYPQMFNVCS